MALSSRQDRGSRERAQPQFPGMKDWHPDFQVSEATQRMWLDAHSPRWTIKATVVAFAALATYLPLFAIRPYLDEKVLVFLGLGNLVLGTVAVLWWNVRVVRRRLRADRLVIREWEAWRWRRQFGSPLRAETSDRPTPRPS